MLRWTLGAACACVAVTALTGQAIGGTTTYTPLVFGPLGDPGNGLYFTNVYDISADGQSYVGVLNNNTARYASAGTLYTMSGPGGPFGISADGQTAVGGLSGQQPVRWNISDAVGSNVPSQALANIGQPATPAYGVNANGTAFNFSTPTGVASAGVFTPANGAFTAVDPAAFAGANRGMAAYAPVSVVLGFVPGEASNAWRWDYLTGDIAPLTLPAGATALQINGTGTQISGDGSIVGGSITIPSETALGQPAYWDAMGVGHTVPGVGGRVWGDMFAVNYPGTWGGGSLFGAGLERHAYLYDFDNDESYDLNDLFAEQIPDGWVLVQTQHISDDASRVFVQARAPDGSLRFVLLEGEVPAPGALTLLGGALMVAPRRRR